MTLSQAVLIIEKSQEDITDKVLLGEDPYPPDEYYIAVGTVLPYLKCLSCISSHAVKDSDKAFCENATHFISPEPNAEELPFG